MRLLRRNLVLAWPRPGAQVANTIIPIERSLIYQRTFPRFCRLTQW